MQETKKEKKTFSKQVRKYSKEKYTEK